MHWVLSIVCGSAAHSDDREEAVRERRGLTPADDLEVDVVLGRARKLSADIVPRRLVSAGEKEEAQSQQATQHLRTASQHLLVSSMQ